MKNVRKSSEPTELTVYRQRFARQPTPRSWADFKKRIEAKSVFAQLQIDQRGLCAYCEIDLTENDRSVEHFVPAHQSTSENNVALRWENLLLVCKGGLQADAVDDSELESYRRSLPPNAEPCCGACKGSHVPDGRLLNPLELPAFPRLFRVNSLDGTIVVDAAECTTAGIDAGHAEFTIQTLGLNCFRLRTNRLAVIQELETNIERLEPQGGNLQAIEREIAEIYFGDGSTRWPPFFTTYRSFLGASAEEHLQRIQYKS